MIMMMGPTPAPEQMPTAQAQGFPLSQAQMIAIAILAVAYFQRAKLGRNGLMAAVAIAAALLLNERRSGYRRRMGKGKGLGKMRKIGKGQGFGKMLKGKREGYCPDCRK